MEQKYIAEETFNKKDFRQSPLSKGEYENCVFINCEFSNADLSSITFIDCEFESCNLSMANVTKTALQKIQFIHCKMLGLHFENCNQFGLLVGFDNCNLSHSSFYEINFKKTVFKNSKLNDVDFTECDLSFSVFDNCDLAGALFDTAVIEKADFRTAFNYTIGPERNRIKNAHFSIDGIPGLLYKYDIKIHKI